MVSDHGLLLLGEYPGIVHGVAAITPNDPLLAEFIGAELIVRVAATETFINSLRYLHKYRSPATSKYAPQAGSA